MTAVHEYIKGEEINTRLGVLKVDDRGIVINAHELKCDPAEIVALPGFMDADLFPPKGYVPGTGIPVPGPKEDIDDDQLWSVICEIVGPEEKNLNSEGYVDMKPLNEALKERGFKPVTGSRRKDVTVERQKKKA